MGDHRTNPIALRAWFYDQYRGELTAGDRIEALRDAFADPASRAYRVLSVIAAQERTHAGWIGALLAARGLAVEVTAKPDRYWRHVLPEIADLATGAAVSAHAEQMRLERDRSATAGCPRRRFVLSPAARWSTPAVPAASRSPGYAWARLYAAGVSCSSGSA